MGDDGGISIGVDQVITPPIGSSRWVGPNRRGKTPYQTPPRSWAKPSRSTHHHPREMSNFPPQKKNKNCFSASKPQQKKKWLIFLQPVNLQGKCSSKHTQFAPLKTLPAPLTPETFDTSSEGLIELDHQTSIKPCLSYGLIIQQPKTPKTNNMHNSRMIPFFVIRNEKPGFFIQQHPLCRKLPWAWGWHQP